MISQAQFTQPLPSLPLSSETFPFEGWNHAFKRSQTYQLTLTVSSGILVPNISALPGVQISVRTLRLAGGRHAIKLFNSVLCHTRLGYCAQPFIRASPAIEMVFLQLAAVRPLGYIRISFEFRSLPRITRSQSLPSWGKRYNQWYFSPQICVSKWLL